MFIDLSHDEIYDLLSTGSTNQRNFIKSIKEHDLRYWEVFDVLDDFINENIATSNTIDDLYNFDIRSLLNGGVLKIISSLEFENPDDFKYYIETFYAVQLDEDQNVYLIIE